MMSCSDSRLPAALLTMKVLVSAALQGASRIWGEDWGGGALSDGLAGGIRIRLRAFRLVQTRCYPVSSLRAVLPMPTSPRGARLLADGPSSWRCKR